MNNSNWCNFVKRDHIKVRSFYTLTVTSSFLLKKLLISRQRMGNWGHIFLENCKDSNVCKNIKNHFFSRSFRRFKFLFHSDSLKLVLQFFLCCFIEYWVLGLNDKNSIKWVWGCCKKEEENINLRDHARFRRKKNFLMFLRVFEFLQFSRKVCLLLPLRDVKSFSKKTNSRLSKCALHAWKRGKDKVTINYKISKNEMKRKFKFSKSWPEFFRPLFGNLPSRFCS